MIQLKESAAKDRFSTGRSKSRNSYFSPGKTGSTVSAVVAIDAEANGIEAAEKKSSFAEDFMLEHSSANLFIAMMGSAGKASSYVSAPKESHKSTQHYGFPS